MGSAIILQGLELPQEGFVLDQATLHSSLYKLTACVSNMSDRDLQCHLCLQKYSKTLTRLQISWLLRLPNIKTTYFVVFQELVYHKGQYIGGLVTQRRAGPISLTQFYPHIVEIVQIPKQFLASHFHQAHFGLSLNAKLSPIVKNPQRQRTSFSQSLVNKKKILHTEDTSSLDQCGQQDRYKFEEVA